MPERADCYVSFDYFCKMMESESGVGATPAKHCKITVLTSQMHDLSKRHS